MPAIPSASSCDRRPRWPGPGRQSLPRRRAEPNGGDLPRRRAWSRRAQERHRTKRRGATARSARGLRPLRRRGSAARSSASRRRAAERSLSSVPRSRVEPPAILFFRAGRANHGTDPPLAASPRHQRPQQRSTSSPSIECGLGLAVARSGDRRSTPRRSDRSWPAVRRLWQSCEPVSDRRRGSRRRRAELPPAPLIIPLA